MSSYISARMRLIADAAQHVCATLGVDVDSVEAIRAARRLMAESFDPVTLFTTLAPSTREAIQVLAPAPWAAADASARLAIPDLAVLADETRAALEAATAAVGRAARSATVDAIVDFARTARQDFDTVSVCAGDRVTALDLRRENEVLYIEVDDTGRVDRDYHGLAGDSCQTRDRQLVEYLKGRGIVLHTQEEDRHGGRRDGVRLLGPAARRDPANPARGGVLNAERPVRTLWSDAGTQAATARSRA